MEIKSNGDFLAERPALKGAYKDVENDHYHSEPALSRSDLELIQRSPAHWKHKKDNPEDNQSEAMFFGNLVHTAVLEPEKMEYNFINDDSLIAEVREESDKELKNVRATKLYKDKVEALHQSGKRVLSGANVTALENVRLAVVERPEFQATVAEGMAELSCFAEMNGVLCKSRPDWLAPKRGFIIDLKTTIDASPKKFIDTIYRYGYHRQAAYYMDVVKAATGVMIHGYGIIAVEKEPPYGVCCFQMTNDFIEIGRAEYQEAFKKFKQAKESGNYPAYPDGWQMAVPKPWMYFRTEGEQNE